MEPSQIVTWVLQHFNLGDQRRTRALGEMVAGLIKSGKVGFAAIGRAMTGAAKKASKITRVFNFCHNEKVEPCLVQAALVRLLVEKTTDLSAGLNNLVAISVDWHYYNHGQFCGLRVSLMTGSRAITLRWYEVESSELKGRQKEIEYKALEDLIECRPLGVTWVVLMDSGFRSSQRLRKLKEVGYFILRSDSATKVHLPRGCWTAVGKLGVGAGQVVEFGYVRWSRLDPEPVRLVACKLNRLVARIRRTRRASGALGRSRVSIPGLWPLLTNLPAERFSALQVVRLYARRFECEHNFRDIKNATLGLDMEHAKLESPATYERLLCIVAVAEALLWVIGAEAESQGLAKDLSPSRPKDAHRVLSLHRVGLLCFLDLRGSLRVLFGRHLAPAIQAVPKTVSRGWVDAVESGILEGCAYNLCELLPLSSVCNRKRLEAPPSCSQQSHTIVFGPTESLYQNAA